MIHVYIVTLTKVTHSPWPLTVMITTKSESVVVFIYS